MHDYKVIVFDLDGTLLNTSKGIFNSVRYAAQQLGLKQLEEYELKKFVGPPPTESYRKVYNLSEEQAKQAASLHRKYGLEKAVYEAEHYDGIQPFLQKLKLESKYLAVATLKREDIAKKVLNHFGLGEYFDTIVGIDVGESLTKADTIGIVKKRLNLSDEPTVLIGDSPYDAVGAQEAGVDFIGVTYGFGFSDENEVAQYPHVACADSVKQLAEFFNIIY